MNITFLILLVRLDKIIDPRFSAYEADVLCTVPTRAIVKNQASIRWKLLMLPFGVKANQYHLLESNSYILKENLSWSPNLSEILPFNCLFIRSIST